MKSKKIGIIDLRISNLESVKSACRNEKINFKIIKKKKDFKECYGLIIPGVGSFGQAIKNLTDDDLLFSLIENIKNKPSLGICLGMQLLLDSSKESPDVKGLGIIKGNCLKFRENLITPHMGWNKVYIKKKDPLFNNIEEGSFFYFVHSYYANINNKSTIFTETNYLGFQFVSSFKKENIYGVQFHPEKSSINGLKMYKNFSKIINLY